ncbi:MAG: hypothetical protein ACXVQX_03555 [Actinomycetota bacterium]
MLVSVLHDRNLLGWLYALIVVGLTSLSAHASVWQLETTEP